VYCPAQTPPENGFFVQNVCNNHFEAACGVRCQPGFELHGTGIRLCQADGSWSGTPASCRVRSCPPLSRPQHGLLRCSDGGASYRTQCQVGCERGYRLEGNSTVTCQANSQWSGPLPRCVAEKPLWAPDSAGWIVLPFVCDVVKEKLLIWQWRKQRYFSLFEI
ncbi:hypothetical protein XENORESO_008690, partial [Xenotaenia resolanae]